MPFARFLFILFLNQTPNLAKGRPAGTPEYEWRLGDVPAVGLDGFEMPRHQAYDLFLFLLTTQKQSFSMYPPLGKPSPCASTQGGVESCHVSQRGACAREGGG